jgi:predicted nucleic acid-binding protein
MNYADTGFIVSLYLEETTSEAASKEAAAMKEPLALTPLSQLEIRNAFNRAVNQGRITLAQRDTCLEIVEGGVKSGLFVETPIPSVELHAKARELSDCYTPTLATRSLDLLHVAAAALLGAKVFYSFDERQRKAAAGQGLKVKP